MAEPELGGLLNIAKARGPSSHEVVDMVRGALGIRRVGHAGTLDPAAAGVLPILFGRVTRLARFFAAYRKEYWALVELGAETTTGDAEGEVVYRREVPVDACEGLAAVARSFVGEIMQEVPVFSAVKVGGERLYRKARRGENVVAPSRPVTVYRFDVEEVTPPRVSFIVECGSGTYVRALARDLGRKLGVGAHIVELTRRAVGPFPLADALPQEKIRGGRVRLLSRPHYTPAAALLPEVPALTLGAAAAQDAVHGRAVAAHAGAEVGGTVRLLDEDGPLLGIGVVTAAGRIQPDTILITPEELKRR